MTLSKHLKKIGVLEKNIEEVIYESKEWEKDKFNKEKLIDLDHELSLNEMEFILINISEKEKIHIDLLRRLFNVMIEISKNKDNYYVLPPHKRIEKLYIQFKKVKKYLIA